MAITPLPTPPSRSDPANFADRGDAFLGALPTFVTEANALATATNQNEINAELAETNAETAQAAAEAARDAAQLAETNAETAETNAENSATAAAASAASAAAIAGAFVSTSTTSWTPTIGSQAFTVQANEQYTAGIFVTVVSASAASNWGFGQVTSYSGTTLTVDIQVISGSTTKTDWNISLTGTRGPAGTGITEQSVGFTMTGGTTSKTLTVDDSITTSEIVTLTEAQTLTNKTITGLKETKTAISASDLDLSAGNYFSKTISGTTTFTVSNTASSGSVNTIILDLTNGGSATVNFWSNVKWAGGTPPTLTSSGRDVLGFFTHDGGTTWSGLVLGKDLK